MSEYQNCPECHQRSGQLKRHLVAEHGYRYTEVSPHFPVKQDEQEIIDEEDYA